MTFDERVRALEPLGFSERQTRFLVTVALHSGFCLRRHYTAFAGLKYGAGVRDFLEPWSPDGWRNDSTSDAIAVTFTTCTPARFTTRSTRTTTAIVVGRARR